MVSAIGSRSSVERFRACVARRGLLDERLSHTFQSEKRGSGTSAGYIAGPPAGWLHDDFENSTTAMEEAGLRT